MPRTAALEDPAPRYAPGRDAVVTFHQPHFGRHRWALPLHAKPAAAADSGACGARSPRNVALARPRCPRLWGESDAESTRRETVHMRATGGGDEVAETRG